MIIMLDENYRIAGNEHCWQLEKRKVVKGRTEWRPFKYCTTMDNALREAAQREIRTHPAEKLSDAIEACIQITQKYSRFFDEVGGSE